MIRKDYTYTCPECETEHDHSDPADAACGDCGRCPDCAPQRDLGSSEFCDMCGGVVQLVRGLRLQSEELGTEGVDGSVAVRAWRREAAEAGDLLLVAAIDHHGVDELAEEWDNQRGKED